MKQFDYVVFVLFSLQRHVGKLYIVIILVLYKTTHFRQHNKHMYACVCVCVVKGVGKGVIGVVTLPTSGVIDFGSHAFESIHR